jgi:hypothetical protein
MSPGIPPSIDRQDQMTTLVVGSIILIAMFIAALYVVVDRTVESGASEESNFASEASRLDDYLAEEERASAYAVVRDYIDQMPLEEDVVAVFCRDSSHRWIDDVIEFQGEVDYQMSTGDFVLHDYTARLTGSKQDGWEVVSVEVTNASAEEDVELGEGVEEAE